VTGAAAAGEGQIKFVAVCGGGGRSASHWLLCVICKKWAQNWEVVYVNLHVLSTKLFGRISLKGEHSVFIGRESQPLYLVSSRGLTVFPRNVRCTESWLASETEIKVASAVFV
jgi:hypothetical protein